MSDKVEIKKVLEFFDYWITNYCNLVEDAEDRYISSDPDDYARRDRLKSLVDYRKAQANTVQWLKESFDNEFNYGLGRCDDQ